MKCLKCGNTEYYAHQQVYVDVVVDENNNFIKNTGGTTEASIYESNKPYGPYTCTKCRAQYEELK
jgi:hypothetical protein